MMRASARRRRWRKHLSGGASARARGPNSSIKFLPVTKSRLLGPALAVEHRGSPVQSDCGVGDQRDWRRRRSCITVAVSSHRLYLNRYHHLRGTSLHATHSMNNRPSVPCISVRLVYVFTSVLCEAGQVHESEHAVRTVHEAERERCTFE